MTIRYKEHPTMFADEPLYFILSVLAIAIFGLGLVILAIWYVNNRTTLLTVTDDRVMKEMGIFNKKRTEIDLKSIRTVKIDQSFVDRIFNCGILKIYTAGDQPELMVKGLPDPARLREALRV